MGRYLLACALLCVPLLGCSPSQKPSPAPGSGAAAPIELPKPAAETGPGPDEKDLPKALDLPLYPGSKVVDNKKTASSLHVTLETVDPVKKVVDFYNSHGIPGVAKSDAGQSMGSTKNGSLVIIDISRKEGKTKIMIKDSPSAVHG